MAYIL